MEQRVYVTNFLSAVVTGIVDFFEIAPAVEKPVEIHAIYISQESEEGDAEEELIPIQILRGYTTTGTGGTQAETSYSMNPKATTPAATVDTVNTTVATGGTADILHTESPNVRQGWVYSPAPEDRPQCTTDENRIACRLMVAPNDPITFNGSIVWAEVV